jgi:hypothetical protein
MRLTLEELQKYQALNERVNAWARSHDDKRIRDDFWYSAPYVTFRNALEAGVISGDEHDLARRAKGDLWNYVGD